MIPTKLISAKAVMYLGIALCASMAGNGWLTLKLYSAGERCAHKLAQARIDDAARLNAAKDRREDLSAVLAADSDERAEEAVKTADKATEESKEVIRNAYQDAPAIAPPAGPCVGIRPVPDRVYDEITAAVARTNRKR